ncbi:MAG: ComF family protein [Caldimicrobium sp.]
MLEKILSNFINFFFPSFCISCGRSLTYNEILFCDECFSKLPIAKSYCNRCGTLLSESLLNFFSNETLIYCSFCEKQKLPYDKVFIGFLYKDPIKKLLYKAKFSDEFSIAYHLGKLLRKVCSINLDEYDLISPIPLSIKRQRQRGYNQSLLILWGYVGIKKFPQSLTRVKHTKPQSFLDSKERWENIKDAFQCTENLNGKRVLLLDDVMTTGATLIEASSILKKAGAKEVHLLVLARA